MAESPSRIEDALAKKRLVGPPSPRSKYDNLPREVKPVEPDRSSLMDVLLPLILSQGLDFISTEKPLGFNRREDLSEVANPFPGARSRGFGGTAGRTVSMGAELLLAALLAKRKPSLAKMYIVPSVSSHASYAYNNLKMAENRDMLDKLLALAAKRPPSPPPIRSLVPEKFRNWNITIGD
jgi:hypothetical protein